MESPSSLRALLWAALLAPLAGGQTPDFATEVWPVIQSRCVSCHRSPYTDARGLTRRPKGGLRLDDPAGFRAGSSSGSVLTPGEPEKSLLYTVVTLPPEHPDVMPATGDPLPAASIELLRRWIAGGAQFGDWTGPAPEKPVLPEGSASAQKGETGRPSRRAVVTALARDLGPPPAAALAGLAEPAQVRPEVEGTHLYQVRFVALESAVDDGMARRVVPLAPNLSWLDLSNTGITDAFFKPFDALPRLTRLDLAQTEIGDATIARLREAPELRTLNLLGTDVTDQGLESVATGYPRLESLFLRDTKVSAAGVARLRERRPALRVFHEVNWPAPDAEPRERRPRRRGND